MNKVAASYCVYENCGFLAESIYRIYHVIDKIYIFLNHIPWNGVRDDKLLLGSLQDILNIFDPLRKIEVVSGFWPSEADQRNYSLELLNRNGYQWEMLIDDDELFDHSLLNGVLNTLRGGLSEKEVLFTVYNMLYWKNRNHVIKDLGISLPTFIKTDGKVKHTFARMVNIGPYISYTIKPETVLNHHFSYVRSDEKIKRKIGFSSHAKDEIAAGWYENVWKKWTPEMINLSPNPQAPHAFSKAINEKDQPYHLPAIKIPTGNFLNILNEVNSTQGGGNTIEGLFFKIGYNIRLFEKITFDGCHKYAGFVLQGIEENENLLSWDKEEKYALFSGNGTISILYPRWPIGSRRELIISNSPKAEGYCFLDTSQNKTTDVYLMLKESTLQ